MRLLEWKSDDDFSLTKGLIHNIPPYAILSHTWGADTEEVTFEDLTDGSGKSKAGYNKIRFCGEQARRDGLQYFWVDTCCIDKSSSAELTEAINSMFRWYREAAKCYVYLSDVSKGNYDEHDHLPRSIWKSAFRGSRWFTRGWTLQELIAPTLVEFYSLEGMRLGDKRSMEQQIHEITGIPVRALRGNPLSDFSLEERLSWALKRKTTREEDKAYSLLGIFNIHMPLIYGEGEKKAFKRLREEIYKASNGKYPTSLNIKHGRRLLTGSLGSEDNLVNRLPYAVDAPLNSYIQMKKEDKECIQHLRLTDPRDDKMRIEETKGGLLEDSYLWIFENSDFQQWRNDQQSRLLWIKGDPGKGKTMLLCGIVNELKKSMAKTDLLSYFFCQATDSRINNATAVLRGLVYLLVDQQPSLISHVRKKHDHAGKTLFEDANAWVALSEIFKNILQDPSLNCTYLIIDALDECLIDLPKLLDFVIEKSSVSPRVKWIISSRNWPDIEERLERAGHKVRLCLELNAESISTAVSIYIQHKVQQLAKLKKYDDKTRVAVLQHLASNANDTFLWVALVCQNLAKISRWNTLEKLNAFPPGLDSLYDRMMEQIRHSDNACLCKRILASTAIVYRPITLKELKSLVETLEDMSDDLESLGEIIGLCGSFLTIREGTVYFVHQSAKDYLLIQAFDEVFPSGKEETHYVIFSRSLQVMSRTLRRDIYGLHALGYPIERAEPPDPNPLAASRYSCIYWVDHLCDWISNPCANHKVDLQDGGSVDEFVRKKYLYWLEALSLCGSMSDGVVSMAKLEALFQVILGSAMLSIYSIC